MIKSILNKPDTFGALASTLCVVHCLMTPLLFIVNTCSIGGCEASPIWWRNLDFIFLIISLFAVARSAKSTTKNFMKSALWISWSTMFLLIVNEKNQFILLPETMTYVAALLLALLHIYNLKYCQCKTDKCCSNHE